MHQQLNPRRVSFTAKHAAREQTCNKTDAIFFASVIILQRQAACMRKKDCCCRVSHAGEIALRPKLAVVAPDLRAHPAVVIAKTCR